MDLNEIKKIIKDFEKSELNELEIKVDNNFVKIKKKGEEANHAFPVSVPVIEKHEVQAPVLTEPKKEIKGTEVKAPLVGTFYAQPAPDKPPYVKVGDRVKKDQVLCIVEAMKVMNEIVSPVDGTIKEICVQNEQFVEFDQTLFIIE